MQGSGGYVDAFGYPVQAAGFTSLVSCPPSTATGPSGASSTLPYGPGGNPIALTYYGQIIDVVRRPPFCALPVSCLHARSLTHPCFFVLCLCAVWQRRPCQPVLHRV